jgi:prepilin-type processing-associated H-X9-DG protein
LLVVVGIIAILIAFLMPALRKAREAAITTSCLSNLKQIGYAIQMYAHETGGWIPPPGDNTYWRFAPGQNLAAPAGGSHNMTWPERIVFQGVIKRPGVNWLTHYPVHGRRGTMFACPGYTYGVIETGQSNKGSYDVLYAGYGYNRMIVHELDDVATPAGPMDMCGFVKLVKLKKDRVMIADGYLRINLGTTSAGAQLYRRHVGGANYLFSDLHAEWSGEYHKQGVGTNGQNNIWNHRDYDIGSSVGRSFFVFVPEYPQPH